MYSARVFFLKELCFCHDKWKIASIKKCYPDIFLKACYIGGFTKHLKGPMVDSVIHLFAISKSTENSSQNAI